MGNCSCGNKDEDGEFEMNDKNKHGGTGTKSKQHAGYEDEKNGTRTVQ